MAPEPAHTYPLTHSTREGDMLPASRFYIALSCSLAWHPVVASPQSSQAQAVKSSGDAKRAEPSETAKLIEERATRTRAARELALHYINVWSAPNPVALAFMEVSGAQRRSSLRSAASCNAGQLGITATVQERRLSGAKPRAIIARFGRSSIFPPPTQRPKGTRAASPSTNSS